MDAKIARVEALLRKKEAELAAAKAAVDNLRAALDILRGGSDAVPEHLQDFVADSRAQLISEGFYKEEE